MRAFGSARRSVRQDAAHNQVGFGPGCEPLEPRLVLADLGVAWDEQFFRIPTAVVPGDRFDPEGGQFRLEAPILIANNGPFSAVGNVTIQFYISTDTVLSSADPLLREYRNEPLSLDVFNGDRNTLGEFSPDMRIPAQTTPGLYFLIVRIIPSSVIGDFNQANNIAVSSDTINVVRQFGDFSGRTNVVLTMQDTDGTFISFSATGGGSGTVSTQPEGFGLTLNGTGNNSRVTLSSTAGDGKYDLAFVTINGSLNTLSAPDARLRGSLTATTGYAAITLGDIVGPRVITVPNTSAAPAFRFASVQNLSIVSSVGISSIVAGSWIDNDSTPDTITAPWLGALSSTGELNLSLDLAGRTGAPTLGDVNVGGQIRGGTWVVRGSGTIIRMAASAPAWAATFQGPVNTLQTTTGLLRGAFSARSLQSIISARDISGATILAGAFLGTDARLGGTAAAADTFGAGFITTITVVRNIANSTIGAGLDPVDGIFRNGNDRILGGHTSRIGTISVGNTVGAGVRILSARYVNPISIGGSTVDWRSDQRFSLSTTGPAASLISAVQSVVEGANVVDVTVRFDSTSLLNLSTLAAGAVRIVTPGSTILNGSLLSRVFTPGSLKASGTMVVRFVLGDTTNPPAAGDYDVRSVAGIATDVRGNAATDRSIGTVQV